MKHPLNKKKDSYSFQQSKDTAPLSLAMEAELPTGTAAFPTDTHMPKETSALSRNTDIFSSEDNIKPRPSTTQTLAEEKKP